MKMNEKEDDEKCIGEEGNEEEEESKVNQAKKIGG